MSDGKYTSDNVPKCPLHAEYKSLICPKKLQRDFIRPDQPSKCEWVKNKNEQHKSPHSQRSL